MAQKHEILAKIEKVTRMVLFFPPRQILVRDKTTAD